MEKFKEEEWKKFFVAEFSLCLAIEFILNSINFIFLAQLKESMNFLDVTKGGKK